jgi:hypothetical protein
MRVREILERALESGNGYGTPQMYETRIREALAALDAEGVGVHIEAITQAIREDEGYAISWHANLAMAYQDEGGDHATANRAAARFMQQLFGVDTSSAIPLPGQSPEPSTGLREAVERVRDMLRVRQALEPELTTADLAGRAADRLDAALRAEEGEAWRLGK